MAVAPSTGKSWYSKVIYIRTCTNKSFFEVRHMYARTNRVIQVRTYVCTHTIMYMYVHTYMYITSTPMQADLKLKIKLSTYIRTYICTVCNSFKNIIIQQLKFGANGEGVGRQSLPVTRLCMCNLLHTYHALRLDFSHMSYLITYTPIHTYIIHAYIHTCTQTCMYTALTVRTHVCTYTYQLLRSKTLLMSPARET